MKTVLKRKRREIEKQVLGFRKEGMIKYTKLPTTQWTKEKQRKYKVLINKTVGYKKQKKEIKEGRRKPPKP